MPVYNDWKSLNLLLSKIDKEIGEKSNKADILVINDNSSEEIYFNTKLFKNFQNLKIITLNKNLGSQKSIAIGLKYLLSEKKDYLITVLDSDGEDDPSKINEMIENAQKFKNFVIVSSRTNRKEYIFGNTFIRWYFDQPNIKTGIYADLRRWVDGKRDDIKWMRL